MTSPTMPAGEVLRDRIADLRQHEVQAIGAGLSRRDWHATETAYCQLRDKLDTWLRDTSRPFRDAQPVPNASSIISAVAPSTSTDAEPAATKTGFETTPAQSPAVQDDGWQPIETAPKDGTKVILWHALWSCLPTVGYFNKTTRWWRFGDEKHWIGVGIDPSHWRPLPPPPSAPLTPAQEP